MSQANHLSETSTVSPGEDRVEFETSPPVSPQAGCAKRNSHIKRTITFLSGELLLCMIRTSAGLNALLCDREHHTSAGSRGHPGGQKMRRLKTAAAKSMKVQPHPSGVRTAGAASDRAADRRTREIRLIIPVLGRCPASPPEPASRTRLRKVQRFRRS